jgi:exodeoxyribonuclease V gamma subunit
LINNPCFLGRFEDSAPAGKNTSGEPLNIEQWLEWADELNVFYGIDNESQQAQGYLHLEQDIYHWEQAFRRLTLAEMVTAPAETGIFSIAEQQIAPAKIPDEWSEEAARFMLIVRSLIADTRDLPKWEMSGKEWGEYLQILLKTYLKPLEQADEEAFQNLLRNVQAARDLDLAQEHERSFSFSTIHEFFKQKQQSGTLQRGHYLAEGVTVSSFQPMRPIPFKAVFLLGLGEGMFPTPYQRDTLDLRHIR